MSNNTKADLFEYLRRTSGKIFRLIWPFLGLSIMFFVLSLISIKNGSRTFSSFAILIISGLILFYLLRLVFSSKNVHKRCMAELEERDDFPDILDDYKISVPMADYEIRLGDKYFFINESETVCEYKDIQSVYQYAHSTNFIEDKRELRVKMKNGRDIFCKLPLRAEGKDEYARIVLYFLHRNPQIQVNKR